MTSLGLPWPSVRPKAQGPLRCQGLDLVANPLNRLRCHLLKDVPFLRHLLLLMLLLGQWQAVLHDMSHAGEAMHAEGAAKQEGDEAEPAIDPCCLAFHSLNAGATFSAAFPGCVFTPVLAGQDACPPSYDATRYCYCSRGPPDRRMA